MLRYYKKQGVGILNPKLPIITEIHKNSGGMSNSELNKPIFSQICCYIVAKENYDANFYRRNSLKINDLLRFLAEGPGFELEVRECFCVPPRIKQCHNMDVV